LAGVIAVEPPGAVPSWAAPADEGRRVVRDSLVVTLGGQLERALGTLTALALRWGLDPAGLGVYTGLRLYLDNTNRTSLGVGLGAVQEIPVLRASGREAEARHLADVAHTTNTLTCLIYAAGLVAWAAWHSGSLTGDPLAREWTWGLIAVAGLALIKRYETFLVAVLRSHREFALTAELDVVESLASALAVGLGLWLAGFWGLLAAVGVVLAVKIAWAHARNPLRFRWAWDGPLVGRLMRVGLPILANTAVWAGVLGVDRVLILARLPDGDRAAGLYTIALMGTGWSLDLAGRVVLVMYAAFQTTLGRTGDPAAVARQAALATEAQAPVLLAGAAVACVVGPEFLGALMPKYVGGLPALRPLLPGTVLLGLAWPARQFLITVGRPYSLFLATLLGLAATAAAGAFGADRAGLVGVAGGTSVGYAAVFLLTSGAAFVPALGFGGWLRHLGRLVCVLSYYVAGAALVAAAPIGLPDRRVGFALRCLVLCGWLAVSLGVWLARGGRWRLLARALGRRRRVDLPLSS